MIQKHIVSKNTTGTVEFNKNSLGDLADLIRLSPTSSRVLLLLMAYADDNNSVITDIKTISVMLGSTEKAIQSAIKNLILNGYVEMKEVEIDHTQDIYGVIHDKHLYYKTHKKVWKVIGEKFVTSYKISGTYNRFYINDYIVKCSNNRENTILKHIKGNLFYDKTIDNSDIRWEM